MSKTTSTPKAPTKRENYTAIRAFLVANNADASLVAAIDHELELLAKRAEKPAKSEEQVNADNALVEAIVATLGNGKAMTVSDMQKNCSALSLTTAGVSCLCLLAPSSVRSSSVTLTTPSPNGKGVAPSGASRPSDAAPRLLFNCRGAAIFLQDKPSKFFQ